MKPLKVCSTVDNSNNDQSFYYIYSIGSNINMYPKYIGLVARQRTFYYNYCKVFLIDMYSHECLEDVELCWHWANFGEHF